MSTILIDKKSQITTITLNRPKTINAINLQMVEELQKAISEAENDDTKVILLKGAGERGLSGGGDIKEMAAHEAENAATFIKNEYILDLQIATAKKPVVAFMSGITMGGGIGVSGHATVRIVTENSRLAMPEAKIGIIPDVGGNLLLAKSPGRMGEYLALTATSMKAEDAIAMGFADFLLTEEKIADLVSKLEAEDVDHNNIKTIVESFAVEPAESTLLGKQTWFEKLFDDVLQKTGDLSEKDTNEPGASAMSEWVVRFMKNLIQLSEEETENSQTTAFAKTLRSMSPTSLAVGLAQIVRTRKLNLDLEEVLADDLRVVSRLFKRPDFVEGVRALIIDKDQNPRWSPNLIEDLNAKEVAKILDPK